MLYTLGGSPSPREFRVGVLQHTASPTSERIDRLAPRRRPAGRPRMFMRWRDLLFMHWPFAPEVIRPLLPDRLELDTVAGRAWIGVVPFTMRGVRAAGLPALPGCRAFHELNVRTYVVHEGVPGVWFFSLDAAHKLAVRGARRFFHLPYFDAEMELVREGDSIRYTSLRVHRDAPWAALTCLWRIGDARAEARPETLEFFLTERYCLYAKRGERLFRGRIHHRPWPLAHASLDELRSSMLGPLGLREPSDPPHLLYAADLDVEVFGLERL